MADHDDLTVAAVLLPPVISVVDPLGSVGHVAIKFYGGVSRRYEEGKSARESAIIAFDTAIELSLDIRNRTFAALRKAFIEANGGEDVGAAFPADPMAALKKERDEAKAEAKEWAIRLDELRRLLEPQEIVDAQIPPPSH